MAAAMGLAGTPVEALDLFGWLAERDVISAPNPASVPYRLAIEVVGEDRDIERILREASNLHRLQADAPADADALVRRAEADLPRLVDALWGAGHYNASVAIEVADVPLRLGEERTAAARAAEAHRGSALVPVRIVAEPGPVFAIRNVQVLDAASGAALLGASLPARILALSPGDPARSADVVAARARIVDHFRGQSRPFARIVRVDPVVDHRDAAVDLTFTVDPGPAAALGAVDVRGLTGVDPGVVRSFIYAQPGEPYSPEALASIRRTVGQIEALSSVRVGTPDDPQSAGADGHVPVLVDVAERAPRAVGLSARYSSQDGPAVQSHWTHRNLFGGAERLRLEASASYLTSEGPDRSAGRPFYDDMGGRLTASFLKPALGGTTNDLLFDATLLRERTEGYVGRLASATGGIRHRFSERFSIQAGVEVESGTARDAFGEIDYTLVGLPASATYDSTDRPLDPTRGVRITGTVTPYPGVLGSSVAMTVARASASTYVALDDEARTILAGRIGLGSILDEDLRGIPANRRFFAGGGGSVRGFAYKSLGPRRDGEPVGGRSLLEASLEARFRVTQTIGLVPFVDFGSAFEGSLPDFGESIRIGAGLGLRYYTSLGPIRLDIATPLRREGGEGAVAAYLGFGQAF